MEVTTSFLTMKEEKVGLQHHDLIKILTIRREVTIIVCTQMDSAVDGIRTVAESKSTGLGQW